MAANELLPVTGVALFPVVLVLVALAVEPGVLLDCVGAAVVPVSTVQLVSALEVR